MAFKKILKTILPEKIFLWYHTQKARLAAYYYGYPSRELVMIGVTGTKGKTTTANYVWAVLEGGGYTTGLIGTANIRIGGSEVLNSYHMTMPDPFVIQKLLREMVAAGCTHTVMEVTSEGLKQGRQQGIDFDAAIFTNLTPEHLSSHHNNFEEYKTTKGELFRTLALSKKKIIAGKEVKKIICANIDDKESEYYLSFPADLHRTFGVSEADYQAHTISSDPKGVHFSVGSIAYDLSLLGEFNIWNALPAIILGDELEIDILKIKEALYSLTVPGRMEIMQRDSYMVIVDYAHEGASMNYVLDTARGLAGTQKVIVLLGAEGGGRDKTKRAVMGEAVGAKADFVVVSNVDPYEDDPKEIADDIARAAKNAGKTQNKNLFIILDRKKGIKKALSLASPGDVVLITGKGAEQSIVIDGISHPWDDREVVRELLKKV